MVSGMPYISVNSATRNAVNAPIARQSRVVLGWKKLIAKTTNNTMFTATSGHSPYAASAITRARGVMVVFLLVRSVAVAAHHEHHHQRASQHEQAEQHRLEWNPCEREADDQDRECDRVQPEMLAFHDALRFIG